VRYSCFDAPSGGYRYFEDSLQLPINSDLPVPKLPKAAGRAGVPAREAGRPLPAAAREVGRGLRAEGLIVQCPSAGLGGWWGELDSSGKRNVLIAGVVALSVLTAALLLTEKEPQRSV
jgi:hypothetical protein